MFHRFYRSGSSTISSCIKHGGYILPCVLYSYKSESIISSADSLLEAGQFVQTIEHRQGLKVACLKELAYTIRWITETQLTTQAKIFQKIGYGQYLFNLVND